jgi:hypothetical protein
MTTAIIFHDVQDGAVWANARKKGSGSRHEMFGRLGVKCRNFRDPNSPNATGVPSEYGGSRAVSVLKARSSAPVSGGGTT